MDKEQRKKLTQEYKKKDLEKYLESGDSVMANYAKIKLGLNSNPLTKADIESSPDEDLIELLNNKINELAERIYKEDPQKHKSGYNVLRALSIYYQLIYYTNQFEMLIELGDADKFFENTPKEEIEIVAKSYEVIGFANFSKLIRKVVIDNQQLDLVEKEFAGLKTTLDKVRMDFIRRNASQFEIK